jgi:hypothetical protein
MVSTRALSGSLRRFPPVGKAGVRRAASAAPFCLKSRHVAADDGSLPLPPSSRLTGRQCAAVVSNHRRWAPWTPKEPVTSAGSPNTIGSRRSTSRVHWCCSALLARGLRRAAPVISTRRRGAPERRIGDAVRPSFLVLLGYVQGWANPKGLTRAGRTRRGRCDTAA